jgi:hypothetical protein
MQEPVKILKLVQCDGFKKSEQLPEDGQVNLKHVAVDVFNGTLN